MRRERVPAVPPSGCAAPHACPALFENSRIWLQRFRIANSEAVERRMRWVDEVIVLSRDHDARDTEDERLLVGDPPVSNSLTGGRVRTDVPRFRQVALLAGNDLILIEDGRNADPAREAPSLIELGEQFERRERKGLRRVDDGRPDTVEASTVRFRPLSAEGALGVFLRRDAPDLLARRLCSSWWQ